MKEKKWFIGTLIGIVSILLLLVAMVCVIDPYFHYHASIEGVSYRLGNQRYINDGIARHYDYDAIIIGTSMTENFRTSELDDLFEVQSVKLPYAGAAYKEIADSLERCFSYNENIQTVVWAIDYNGLIRDWDSVSYDESEYPSYLYDDNVFNDIKYVLNKEVFLKGVLPDLAYTLFGVPSTTMDDYSWLEADTGADAVLNINDRVERIETDAAEGLTENQAAVVTENIERNFIRVIEEHPETEFYLYFTPYSVAELEEYVYRGQWKSQIEAQRLAAESLMQYDNVHLYCFYGEYDVVTDLDHYRDKLHYTPEINTQILKWMKQGTDELAEENLDAYLDEIYTYYEQYDYDAMYADIEQQYGGSDVS